MTVTLWSVLCGKVLACDSDVVECICVVRYWLVDCDVVECICVVRYWLVDCDVVECSVW